MSQSRPTFRNFVRTGKFSNKFNASVPTEMPDIPEEKIVDGRVISFIQSERGDRRGSATSGVSEVPSAISTSSTKVGEPKAIHTPQPGDLLFLPPEIKSPTTFGPNNEYTAVPSIVTYSAARGVTRMSIREATPDEIQITAPSTLPSTIPHYPKIPPPSEIPIIPPPPGFQSIQASHALPVQPVQSPLGTHTPPAVQRASLPSQSSQLTRISSASSQSIRTSTTSIEDDEAISESDHISSSASQRSIANPSKRGEHLSPCTPSPLLPKSVTGSDIASPRCFSDHSSNGSSPPLKQMPFLDDRGASTPRNFASTPGSSQSRFSWHLSNTDKARSWFTRWFVEWWLLEILSWVFSATCMVIIAIVLWKHDGKALPKWKLGISINAFISVFSGFAKSALLLPTAEALGQLKWDWFRRSEKKMMDFEVMDSASRGPWGSMVMLARTKGITLASVGAAIILLSLPLDLFFQQIISFPSQAFHDSTANATISRAIYYDPNPEITWVNGTDFVSADTQLDSFTYPFFFTQGMTPGVEFDCPTGNCTYDPFHTLAIDFRCKEMPGVLEFGCKDTSAEWMSTIPYEGPFLSPNRSSCGYYLNVPDYQPQLMSGYEVLPGGSAGEVVRTRFFALSDVITSEQYFGGSVNFKDVKNPIVDFILASTPDGFEGALKNNTPVVNECVIYWSVKLLNATVRSGQLLEETLDTLHFESDLEIPWNLDDLTYAANFSMTLDDPHSVTGNTSTFGLNNVTAMRVWEQWAILAPSTYLRPAANNPVKSGPVVKRSWIASPPKLSTAYSPDLPWDAPRNVSQHLSQAVTVMNQVIRRNTLSKSGTHNVSVGLAWAYEVVVHVRWAWISLPAALLLFSLLFLITTVVRSTRDVDNIGIWKTSALAILFNGLGEDVQNHVGQGNLSMGYARARAKELKVHLDDD